MQIKPYIALVIAFLFFEIQSLAQSDLNSQTLGPKELKAVVDSIATSLNRWYVYPDKGRLMADHIKDRYKNGAYNRINSNAELARLFTEHLQQVHKDGHMKVGYFPEEARRISYMRSEAEEKLQREQRLKIAKENHFEFIEKKVYPGNIGYLRWDHFDEFVEEALTVFDSSFKAIAKCDGLIIDFRRNTGGNPAMVIALQNYFFERRTALNHIIDRNGDTAKRFTNPAETSFKLTMPVYILTDTLTFSAGEDFTYTQQQSKRAIIVGKTTGGGAHPAITYNLGNGFIMSVPSKRSVNLTSKTDWEGTGIVPDLEVNAEAALEEALLSIYTKQFSSAKTEARKKILREYINDIKNGKYASIPYSLSKNDDAIRSIEIKDSIFGPTNVCLGFGAVQEYFEKTNLNDHGKPIYIKEENSAWFRIKFDRDTLLVFDIVPVDPTNDYDFMLFKCPGNSCIESIQSRKNLPLRCCNSGFASYNGSTGLSRYATIDCVGLGAGPSYAKALPVKAGEVYYLLVHFAEGYIKDGIKSYGFTLYFHDYWPKKKPRVINNVIFNSNEAVLLPESFSELDKITSQLIKDKSIGIEVRGHADSEGDEEKNKALSLLRAQVVKDYLVAKHIDSKRVFCKGFGSSQPLVSNITEEGKKKNRRVEFVLIFR